MVTPMTTVSKSSFKAQTLKLFRQVERTGEPITITDRGKPVLQLVPYRVDREGAVRMLRKSVAKYRAPTKPVADREWESSS